MSSWSFMHLGWKCEIGSSNMFSYRGSTWIQSPNWASNLHLWEKLDKHVVLQGHVDYIKNVALKGVWKKVVQGEVTFANIEVDYMRMENSIVVAKWEF
jgi:hypothetical protein